MLLGIQIEVVGFFPYFHIRSGSTSILTFQNDQGEDVGSFGSILANIQVTPALLGESLISLKRYSCPPGKRE